MSPSVLRNLGLLLGAYLVFGLLVVVDRDRKPVPDPEDLDCETRSVESPAFDRSPDDSGFRLHMALIKIGPGSDAVLDATSLPLHVGEDFAVSLAFSTVDPAEKQKSKDSQSDRLARFSSFATTREPEDQRRALLPQGFGQFSRRINFRAHYAGASEDVHLIRLDHVKVSYTDRSSNGSSTRSSGAPGAPIALTTGRPVIRAQAAASMFWCTIVLPEDAAFDAGQREAWRAAFRQLPTSDLYPDRFGIDRVVARRGRSGDREITEADQVVAFGPLVERWTAAFALGDSESYVACLTALSDRQDRIEDLRSLASPAREASAWMDFFASCVAGTPRPRGSESAADLQWLRLIHVDSRPEVMQLAASELCSRPLDLWVQAHFAENPPETADTVRRRELERVRAHAIAGLPTPWNFFIERLWLLCSLVPAFALWLVSTRRKPGRPRLRVSGFALFLFAVACFVKVSGLPLTLLILPLSAWFARRWLREDVPHPLGERLLIALILTGLWIVALRSVHWFFDQRHLNFISSISPLAAWLLIGKAILRDGRWQYPGRLGFALSALVASVIAVSFVPYAPVVGSAAIASLFAAAVAFLWFLLGSTKAPERPKMQWTSP